MWLRLQIAAAFCAVKNWYSRLRLLRIYNGSLGRIHYAVYKNKNISADIWLYFSQAVARQIDVIRANIFSWRDCCHTRGFRKLLTLCTVELSIHRFWGSSESIKVTFWECPFATRIVQKRNVQHSRQRNELRWVLPRLDCRVLSSEPAITDAKLDLTRIRSTVNISTSGGMF